jgi:hypothetical protein
MTMNASEAAYDLVLTGGRICDPATGLDRSCDLAVNGDRKDLLKLTDAAVDVLHESDFGEVWSSLFWEIRGRLGPVLTDKILTAGLPWPTPEDKIDAVFVETLVSVLRANLSTSELVQVTAIIRDRGFPTEK